MKNIILIALYIFILSCNGETKINKQQSKVVKSYKNGKLNNTIFYGNDTVFRMIKYYPSGQIESIQNYNNNLLSDTSIFYYENGKIQELSLYKNGLRDGGFYNFYENGVLKIYQYYFSDTAIYEKKFNSNSDMVSQDGFPFRISLNFEKAKNDSAFLLIYSAVPPATFLSLKFTDIYLNEKTEILNYEGLEYPIMYYFPIKQGNHLLEVSLNMIDSASKLSKLYPYKIFYTVKH